MRSLFGSPPAKRRMLPPRLCRLIVDRARPSAEHPALNPNEIAKIYYVSSPPCWPFWSSHDACVSAVQGAWSSTDKSPSGAPQT